MAKSKSERRASFTARAERAGFPEVSMMAVPHMTTVEEDERVVDGLLAKREVQRNTLTFTVPGEPQAKQRARVFALPSGQVRAVTPKETRAYEAKVRTLAQVAVNQQRWTFSDAHYFDLVVKVVRTHWDAGGDPDNYLKAIADAINGVAFPDDRYVRGMAVKLADPDASNPRVMVTVRRYERPSRPKRRKR